MPTGVLGSRKAGSHHHCQTLRAAGRGISSASPEHYSLASHGAAVRYKPCHGKTLHHISARRRKEAVSVEMLIWEKKMRKEERGEGKLVVKSVVLPVTSMESSCWERAMVWLSSCCSVALSGKLQMDISMNPHLGRKSG